MQSMTEKQLDDISALRAITESARATSRETNHKMRWLAIGGGAITAILLVLIVVLQLSPLDSANKYASLENQAAVVSQTEDVKQITTKLGTIDQNLGGIQKELATVRDKLEMESTRQALQLIDQRLEALTMGVGDVPNQTNSAELQQALATSKSQFQALTEQLGGIKQELAGLNLTGSLNEINQQLKQVNDRSSDGDPVSAIQVQQELQTINEQLDMLMQRVAAVDRAETQANSEEIPQLTSRMERLEQEIQAVDASVKENLVNVQNEQSQLTETVESVKARVAELETSDPSSELSAEAWREAAGTQFTIQLMGVSDPQLLRAFAMQTDLGNRLGTSQSQRAGKPWHVLLKGIFKDRRTAQAALLKLPSHLRELKPWVRSIPQDTTQFVP